MRSTFKGNGFSFMASDGDDDSQRTPAGQTEISLSLATKDQAEGDRVFNALAEGGKITMPLGDAFWGGKLGMVDDKYGVSWMVSVYS